MSYSSIFYDNLIKSPLNPPDWVFTPAWSNLYVLLFVSFIIVLKKKSKYKIPALIFFFIQLALNFVWPYVFFGQNNIMVGLYILCALVVFSFITMLFFFAISKRAGVILLIYTIWLIFALHLNYQIVYLNLR